MQAPHAPQKKTAQKNKVWAKNTFLKIGQSMNFLGGSTKSNINLSSLQCKSGDVKMVI
jgi:hypothetical protein